MRYHGVRGILARRMEKPMFRTDGRSICNTRPIHKDFRVTQNVGTSCNSILFRISLSYIAPNQLLLRQLNFSSSTTVDGETENTSSPLSILSSISDNDTNIDSIEEDTTESDAGWKDLHCTIRTKFRKFKKKDVVNAEQCMRWWVRKSRSLLSSKDSRVHTNGPEVVQAIVSALELFGHVVIAIEMQPELLQVTNNSSNDLLVHWYTGQYPRATHVLNAILDAWRICWMKLNDDDRNKLPSPQFVFRVLRDQWSNCVPLNARTYSIVMDAPVSNMPILRSGMPLYEVPIFCEEVLQCMLLQKMPKEVPGLPPFQPLGEMSLLPDYMSYSIALNAWSRSGLPEAASRAEELYQQFATLSTNGILNTAPNTFCYNTLLIAMTAQPKIIVNKRQEILKKATTSGPPRDKKLIDVIMQREQALDRAEQVFRNMQACPFPDVIPDETSWRTIIFAWADYSLLLRYIDRKMSVEFMNRAVCVLYEMAQICVESDHSSLEIHSSFFGKLISTLALNQPIVVDNPTIVDLCKAEEIFQYLMDLYHKTNDKRFEPEASLWSVMIVVYSKNGRPEEAEVILNNLEDAAHAQNNTDLVPRVGYYRDVLDSWILLGIKEMKQGNQNAALIAAERAEMMIFRMIQLAHDTKSVDYVPLRSFVSRTLDLWILCHMPQRAEKFLRLIEEVNEKPQFRELKVRANQFRQVLIAWASDETIVSTDSSQHAEHLLFEMKERYKRSNDVDWRPSNKMISMVIASWCRTNCPDIVGKCKSLFDFAVSEYAAGNEEVRPNVNMYITVLHGYVRAGDAFGAMKFFEIMLHDYRINQNDSAKPSTKVFNMILLCWLLSKNAAAPQQALDVFHLMQTLSSENFSTEPDFRTFSIMSEILETTTSEEFMETKKFCIAQRDLLARKEKKVT